MGRRKVKNRNVYADDLGTPKYRPRIVKSGKTYNRKKDKPHDQRRVSGQS